MRKYRVTLFLLCIGILVLGAAVFLSIHKMKKNASGPFSGSVFHHYITRKGDKLMDGNKEFRFIAADVPELTMIEDGKWHLPTPWEQEDAMKTLKQMGGTATRTYVLSIHKKDDYKGKIRNVEGPGQFNEKSFKAIDKMLQLADKNGIRVIIPLVDEYEWWGGIKDYAAFEGKSKAQFWTDPKVIGDFKETIKYILNRTNTYTGIKYKNDPAILAWETGNELVPKSSTWTHDIAAYIKSMDHHHLVMDGSYGIQKSSLTDPDIDIVSNHYYPNHYKDYVKQVNLDRQETKGKKPLIIGEFSFIQTPQLKTFLNTVIQNGTSGAMLWSLRYHNKDGGFYQHTESTYNGVFYGSYRWPGFPSGSGYDETNALKALSNAAYKIRGLKNPGLPVPAAPQLLPIHSVSDISWQGSVGAQSYTLERAISKSGPWAVLSSNVYDAVTTGSQLYDDTTAKTGQEYYYRVKALNRTGSSPYSNVVGPVKPNHMILDGLKNYSNMYAHTADLTVVGDDPPAYGEDAFRLKPLHSSSSQIVSYALPSSMASANGVEARFLRLVTYSGSAKSKADFKVFSSTDDQQYTPLAMTATAKNGSNETVYETHSFPKQTQYVRIQFPDSDAELGQVEFGYTNDQGSQLMFPQPQKVLLRKRGIIDDDMNNFGKMQDHSSDLQFASDSPQYFGKDKSRLVRTTNGNQYVVYQTDGDMNSFQMTAYLRQQSSQYKLSDFTFYTSSDGMMYKKYTSTNKQVQMGAGYWAKTVYSGKTLPQGTTFLKIVFPAVPSKYAKQVWNPQVSSIHIGVGSKTDVSSGG